MKKVDFFTSITFCIIIVFVLNEVGMLVLVLICNGPAKLVVALVLNF